MSRLPARILAQCLDAIESGETTLEECKTRYPQYREELMPLLRMAATLREEPSMGPRPSFRRTARQRLLAKLPPRAPVQRGIARWPVWQSLPRRATVAWAVVLASLAVLLCSGGIVFAADRTLPGDALYPVKTTVEEARLWIAHGDRDAHLSLQFAETRIQEIKYLGVAGRFDDMATAAGRFESQMQHTDHALHELAERDAELAQALAAQSEEARTAYRRELVELLQAAPDSDRPTVEGILELDDDYHPEDLLDDREEQEAPPPAAVDDDGPTRNDDSSSDDDQPILQERPAEVGEDDEDKAGTSDAPGDHESGGDAGEEEKREDSERHDADSPEDIGDPAPDEPGQDGSDPEDEGTDSELDHDDSDHAAPGTGDEPSESEGSDERDGSDGRDGSDEHDGPDEHDGTSEHDDAGSGHEHDQEHD
ncbi:MAG: DUF5667 domain-containing protein [Anaerolineae bacterium]